MNTKKIILIIIAIALIAGIGVLFAMGGKTKNEVDNGKIKVVVSNFASYDFLRAIIGNNQNVEITYLLGAGKDTHSYEPAASDLIKIQKADLFVYVGGEMEKWVEKVVSSLEMDKTKIICIADYVDTIEEKEVDGAEEHEHEEEEEEGAFDEHIWTSPKNAIKMVEKLEKEMEGLDSANADTYKQNAENYIAKIKDVDKKIQEVVDNKVRDRLVFADKMPMQYFID